MEFFFGGGGRKVSHIAAEAAAAWKAAGWVALGNGCSLGRV